MREFFLNLLNKLDKLTGFRQMDKLMAMPDAKQEINELLDILCGTCRQFNYIPEDDQKKIITENVITDADFQGLNAKILYKWFHANKGKFLKELAHEETKPVEGYKILEGEAREEKIKEWLGAIAKVGTVSQPQLSGTRLKQNFEDIPKMDYKVKDPAAHALHLQWLKECFDAKTGKPNENYIEESKWIELNG